MIEVLVARVQHEAVLEHERRNPHVVGRDGGALSTKLDEYRCVDDRRLFVGGERHDAFLLKEAAKAPFILRGSGARGESGAEFPEHNDREEDLVRRSNERDRRLDSSREIHVPIGVEREPHFQRLSSTWS